MIINMASLEASQKSNPGSSSKNRQARVWIEIFFQALLFHSSTHIAQRLLAWMVAVLSGVFPALIFCALYYWRGHQNKQKTPKDFFCDFDPLISKKGFASSESFPGAKSTPISDSSYSLKYAIEKLLKDPKLVATKEHFPQIWHRLIYEPSFALNNPQKFYILLRALQSYGQYSQLEADCGSVHKLSEQERSAFRCFTMDPGTSYIESKQCVKELFSNPTSMKAGFITCECSSEQMPVVVTAFSNKCFGGGVLGSTLTQAERMILEFPFLLEHMLSKSVYSIGGEFAYCFEQVRRPLNDGPDHYSAGFPSKGHPDPILFKGIERSLVITEKVINSYARSQISALEGLQVDCLEISDSDLYNCIHSAGLPLERVSVLAMAAPALSKKTLFNQLRPEVMLDMVNTAAAGIYIAAKYHANGFVWRTGKLGCGACKNHPLVSYLSQRLAACAQTVPIKIEFFDYKPHEKEQCERAWRDFELACSRLYEPPTLHEASLLLLEVAKRALSK